MSATRHLPAKRLSVTGPLIARLRPGNEHHWIAWSLRSSRWRKALRGWRQLTIGKATSRPLGLARVAKQLAFQRIEAVGSSKETIPAAIAHDDSRRLRADFDDVSVRHCPASVSVRANNGAGGKKFRVQIRQKSAARRA